MDIHQTDTIVTEEDIEKLKKLVLENRRIKLWQLDEEMSITKERPGDILHSPLHMKKMCARWLPNMLTPLGKQSLVTTSQEFLDICGYKPEDVFSRTIIVDEAWIPQYESRVIAVDKKRRKAATEVPSE